MAHAAKALHYGVDSESERAALSRSGGLHRVRRGSSPVAGRSMTEVPDVHSVLAHLQSILDSPEFAHSARMRRFLSFVVEETLAGRADSLKEYTIATHVFDRPASFNPTIDPVVRVEARRLRAKLADYYGRCRSQCGVMITLPKGHYIPQFVPPSKPAAPPAAVTVAAFSPVGAGAERCCETLHFELIDQLTRVHQVKVALHDHSSPRAEGANILTGCIRVHGDQVRVLAHIIESGTAHCQWSIAIDIVASEVHEEQLATRLAEDVVAYLRRR
jgi:TolB-like protein